MACFLSAVGRAQGHWAWKPDSVADGLPLAQEALWRTQGEVPGARAIQGHLKRLLSPGAPPPFSAPEVPSTGQPRPFPEILNLFPSADSAISTNEKLDYFYYTRSLSQR